ncbi:MAG: class I SAM-dependent methyltransferase [Caldilineaceae bacterium]
MMTIQATVDWQGWMQRWDVQQTGYLPDREERFNAMFHVLQTLLPPDFVALDLACGPGSISQRLLTRFPQARSVAVDLDPVLLTLGQNALGDMEGRLRWVEADLGQRDWADKLGDVQFDAVLSTTALHWLPAAQLTHLFRTLANRMRPGGVFLNGDHIPFGPHLPAFDKVAQQYNETVQTAAFTQRGVENWENWWDAIAQEPSMTTALAERERRFAAFNATDRDERNPLSNFYQAALQNAGFTQVGVIWRNMDNQIIMAVP